MRVEARREQLVSLGLRLFAEFSYDELSTDAIARAAGISKGLLFHYFAGKRGFYVATVEEMARRVEAATAPDPTLDFATALARSLQGFVRFVAEEGQLYGALVRGGIGMDPEVFAILERVRLNSVQRVFEVLGVAQPEARQHAVVYGWIGFTEAVCLDWVSRQHLSAEEVVELLLQALLALLQTVSTSSSHPADP